MNMFDENGVSLSQKQTYMPGEDQMLANFVSMQARFLWAATISLDALIAITDIEDDIDDEKTLNDIKNKIKTVDIISAALDKKYDLHGETFSFMDVWLNIRTQLATRTAHRDFVTFTDHGAVISFDETLVAMQEHENREVAEMLGFEQWDQTYEKGLNPFYRVSGTAADIIQFPIE